jgi:hypothetical protein
LDLELFSNYYFSVSIWFSNGESFLVLSLKKLHFFIFLLSFIVTLVLLQAKLRIKIVFHAKLLCSHPIVTIAVAASTG